jgi:hypothetical protein
MRRAFARAINALTEEQFQSLYGPWDPLTPPQVAELLAGSSVRWWIAGGRAARVGAAADRHHDDTDVAVDIADVEQLRRHLGGWDLWEAHDGTLRPLLPGDTLAKGRQQLWVRRNANQPWRVDVLLDKGGKEWVYKKDSSVRVPWEQALHVVDGVTYLRPELALLHKVHLDRPKDRADLAAAALEPDARTWLVDVLSRLGHHEWAELTARRDRQAEELTS